VFKKMAKTSQAADDHGGSSPLDHGCARLGEMPSSVDTQVTAQPTEGLLG
jgi:hypothetical protein